jgi:phenylalanyl-tRNA synthetase beta chain
MRFTLSWLKEFLDTNCSLDEILTKLTVIGLEVEEVIDRSKDLGDFIVAEVLDATRHPEADRLQVCTVNDGENKLQIVCGAQNARAGIKVVLARVGVTIPNGKFKIKASKIRGVESNGMLCSATELLIGSDDNGIIELPISAQVGSSFVETCGLNDPIIEIAITPNRGDALGVYGIARDLAAAGMGKLKTLTIPDLKSNIDSPIVMRVLDTNLCPLISSYYIKGIKNIESPIWLKRRLEAAGVTPISAIIDITNYVSLSFARPLHVYDADKISGSLTVRMAGEGEKFLALNDKEYVLKNTDLVIADDKDILGLAGIIGGKESSCSHTTSNILLEAAVFDHITIAHSGRTHNINTDSRYRFERQIDYNFTIQGLKVATMMITELCDGEISNINLAGSPTKDLRTINFDSNKVYSLLGIKLTVDAIIKILSDLGFGCEYIGGEAIHIMIPSWRNDVAEEADIIEEVARIYGYDNIPAAPIPSQNVLSTITINPKQQRLNSIRRMLAASGFMEKVTWSFMDSNKALLFSDIIPELKLANPISSDLNYMRPSIIPNLLGILKKNIARGYNNLALFEVGAIFISQQHQQLSIAGIRSGLMTERNIHGLTRKVDFFDVKQDVSMILAEYGLPVEKLSWQRDVPSYYHPNKAAKVSLGKNIVAYCGELHPNIASSYDLKLPIFIFEIFTNNIPIPSLKHGRKPAYLISDYQAVERDFAFILDPNTPVAELIKSISAADNQLIKKVSIFDVYIGDKIESNKKSIAISVRMQADDRTLVDTEIETISKKIIDNAAKATGATLRSV